MIKLNFTIIRSSKTPIVNYSPVTLKLEAKIEESLPLIFPPATFHILILLIQFSSGLGWTGQTVKIKCSSFRLFYLNTILIFAALKTINNIYSFVIFVVYIPVGIFSTLLALLY